MGYKETNPNGRGFPFVVPRITHLDTPLGASIPVHEFTDYALETCGKAITQGMIERARAARDAEAKLKKGGE